MSGSPDFDGQAGHQVTPVRKTCLPIHARVGSHRGWKWVNRRSPLTMFAPPTKAMRLQGRVCICPEACPGKVVVGGGRAPIAIGSPIAIWPASMRLDRSVRNARARATAPAMLSSPVPCCSRLAPGSGVAVYCRIALIRGGVRPGLACSSSAAAPETAGADTEVPLSCMSAVSAVPAVPYTRRSGRPPSTDQSAREPMIRLPGATRSGLRKLSARRVWRITVKLAGLSKTSYQAAPRVGPRELKVLTVCALRSTESPVLTEPTVITVGSCPGEPMAPYTSRPPASLPKLPAEATTVMPAAVRLRAARASTSTWALSRESVDRLRFTTRMPSRLWWCSTQSMPASRSLRRPAPSSPSTFTS